MATYKSSEIQYGASAETLFNKISNLEGLKDMLSKIPQDTLTDEQRGMLSSVTISSDSISLPGGPVGSLTLKMTRKESPVLIEFEGQNTPVPLSLSLHINPEGTDSCVAQAVLDIQIPAMLRPMVSGPLQKAVDQLSNLLRAIPK